MNQSVKILETCRVIPFANSTTSVVESCLPLTHFGTMWIKFFPITQRVFFYEIAEEKSTRSFFNSVIIPKLKRSLSVTLTYFLPVAGNIVWPENATKPFFSYSQDDGVLFLVAESSSGFNHFTHNMCDTTDVHPYIPELPFSDSKASVISFQITLFPNQGFSIGISMHHAMFDGKSVAMFMKSWAHVCRENPKQPSPLPLELTPVFDRTLIDDEGIDMLNLNNWWLVPNPNLKSLKPHNITRSLKNVVRATFELSPQDINNLRRSVRSHLYKEDSTDIRLSTFVLSYAYIIVTMVKAKKLDIEGKIGVMFAVDCRSRLNPKLPDNFFGSCVKGSYSVIDTKTILDKNGIAFIAVELRKMVKEMDMRVKNPNIKQEYDEILKFKNSRKIVDMMIGVAGSPRFAIYGTDFGWGKPKKTQVVSIDTNVSISMQESRDGNGSIEIGLVLKKHDMELFYSLFINGLKDM